MAGSARCQVRLTVPRRGGWRARGAVSGEFERRLAEQESRAIAVRVDSWVRRGRDYLQVVIVARVDAADMAEALDLAGSPSARQQVMTAGRTWPAADANLSIPLNVKVRMGIRQSVPALL